jgi:hypothetical protein
MKELVDLVLYVMSGAVLVVSHHLIADYLS